MFDKIKNVLLMIAGVVIGFFALLLGIKNRKIDKLKTEGKVKDVIIKEVNISKDAEKEHAQKVTEIQKETVETVEEIKNGEKGYNDIINDWNNHS